MAKRTKQRPLTAKQEKFCQEYMIDLNATQAALRAGYCANAVNRHNVCNVMGSQNLAKISIKAEIQRLKAIASEKRGIKAEDVVKSFVDVARRAKIKDDLGNENRALENLGKHVGVFEADNAQKGDKTINIINFNNIDDTKQIISGPAGQARITAPKSV